MFDDFKITNYPRSLVSPELYARHLSRLYAGDVVDGLTVTPGSGMQVVLAAGNTLIRYGSGATASARFVSLVNTFNMSVATADVSNPRIDLVVVYVDNGVTLPSGTPSAANLDGKGVAKAKIVTGTAAASPVAPNATAIQASVGSGNPYTVIAAVRVDAGVSLIASNKITDSRVLAKVINSRLDWTTMPQSVSTNGYMQLGPLLIQWGRASASSTGTNITYPQPFSQVPSIAVNLNDPGSQDARAYNITTTTATLRQSYSAGNLEVTWIAMGPA